MGLANEDRALLEQSLERFVRTACTLDRRRALLREGQAFNRENWAALADMGVLGLPLDEEAGGLGGSLADVMAVSRTLASGLALEPFVPCVVTAGRLLAATGTASQRERWLPGMVAGEVLLGLAHLERTDTSMPAVSTTRLDRTTEGYQLSGAKLLVPCAGELAAFIVTARAGNGALHGCLVPRDAAGVTVRPYRATDGTLAGEVSFDAVRIPSDDVLEPSGFESHLNQVLDYTRAVLAADTVGSMRELLRLTIDYCNSRRQFGQVIGKFQVLRHRLVDCYTGLQQAEALLKLVAQTSNPAWSANVAATKVYIDEQAIRLGHESIQMHGAMGLTDELAVSHHHKRVYASAIALGDRRAHVDAFIARTHLTSTEAPSCALHFPELLDADEARFREEVRRFVASSLTDELRLTARRLTCTFPEKEPTLEWQKRLNAQGWLAPLWPKEHGGTGWSAVERFIFEYECGVGGAPERTPMGFRYVGPVLAHFGNAWQQSRFLPPLLASEHYWAQGFSEPGAGSDLAALKTTAVLDGDEYVVNGSKIWTTNAHMADWIFCLVRTSQADRPQDGISFLLIDLKSPGIRIEPIALLAVDHEVNQVFFDGVRVPATHLVGEAGRGWQYAKFLLELERGGSVTCGRLRSELNLAKELLGTTRAALASDVGVMRRLAWLEIRLMALEALEFDCARASTRTADLGVAGSMTKLVSSELQEEITEFGVEVAGPAGLEFVTVRPIPDSHASGYPGSDLERVAMPRYLNTRATTIFAGSSEVQREIISKHVLGLRG